MGDLSTTAKQFDDKCLFIHPKTEFTRVNARPSAKIPGDTAQSLQNLCFLLLIGLAFWLSQATKLNLRNGNGEWKKVMEWDSKAYNHPSSMGQWPEFPEIKAIRTELLWLPLTSLKAKTHLASGKTRSQLFSPMTWHASKPNEHL